MQNPEIPAQNPTNPIHSPIPKSHPSPERLTIEEAKKRCLDMPQCLGFTFRGDDPCPEQCCSAPGAYRDRLWRLWRLSEALAPIGAYRRLTIAPIDSGAYPAPIVGAYRRLAPIKYFHRHFLCIHRMSAQQPAQRKATVRGAYQAPIDR